MRVLVTNDDGAEATGIHHMARALARDPRFEVVMVAPDQDRSGTAASLGTLDFDRLAAVRVAFADDDGVEAWALNATPAMCVMAANLGAFGAVPDLVVSGINVGLNTGRAILYSGTVGAALSAQNLGISALAVSLQVGDPWQWETATTFAMEAVELLIRAPRRSVLNLNVPALAVAEVRGLHWARLAPFGEVRMALTTSDSELDDGRTRRVASELRLAETSFDADTDTGLVRAGYAALTTLVGITETWPSAVDQETDPIRIASAIVPGAPLEPTHEVPDANVRGNLHRPAGAR